MRKIQQGTAIEAHQVPECAGLSRCSNAGRLQSLSWKPAYEYLYAEWKMVLLQVSTRPYTSIHTSILVGNVRTSSVCIRLWRTSTSNINDNVNVKHVRLYIRPVLVRTDDVRPSIIRTIVLH